MLLLVLFQFGSPGYGIMLADLESAANIELILAHFHMNYHE